MAMYLVLEDFNGNIGGPSQTNYVQAGTLLDEAVYDIAAILAQGCPVVLYNAGTMAVSLAAFMSSRTSPQMIANDGNLTALLAAAGVFGELPTGPAGGDLFKTYPNPWVAAIHETNGPTRLQIAGVADGSVLARVGAAVVGVAPTFPPNGAAGGDLGGAYPNPTVVAIEETAGPTRLVAGAIADGQVVKRIGATIVGVPATFPPNGAAGGDLGGAYPNPTVVAIEETSGPTRLVMGAVPALTFLQRVGATVVGTDPNTVVKGPWSSVLYVDNVRGSDVTGTRGNNNLPFATIQAAINAASTGDTVLLAPLLFSTVAALTIPATVVKIEFKGVQRRFSGAAASASLGTSIICTGDNCFDLGANLGLGGCSFSDMDISSATAGKSAILADGSLYAASTFLFGSGVGLLLENVFLGALASVNALTLKYVVFYNFYNVRTFSPISITNCFSGNLYAISAAQSSVLLSYDVSDPLAVGAQPKIAIGANSILGGNGGGAFITWTGQMQIQVDQTSTIGGLKALNLSTHVAPNAVPGISYLGYVGAANGAVFDLGGSGTSEIPDTATVLTFDFRGCNLFANVGGNLPSGGPSTVRAKVAGAAVNFQTVQFDLASALQSTSFIADAAIHMTLRGARAPSCAYATPGANGDINPPMLTGVVDVSAGGSVAKSWVQLGYAGFTRSGAACDTAFLTASAQLSDPVIAAKTTVGLTITSNVVGGDSACNWMAVWK